LRKIFGLKREEDGSWRKLHNVELQSLHSSPLVGRPEGKRALEKPRHWWEDNIKLDLRQTGIDEANWIQLAQHRVQWRACVNTVMNLRVP
jgi:hypothetical protein